MTAALLIAFCSTAMMTCPSSAQSAREGVDAGNKKMMESFQKKDATGIAAVYATDAVVLPPNAQRITGRENIQKMWQQWLDGGLTDLKLSPVTVEESGDLAVEDGDYSLKIPGQDGDEAMDESGKYVVVWKKGADGSWQINRDIWNSNEEIMVEE